MCKFQEGCAFLARGVHILAIIMDMFPHIPHVETCVLLYREDYKSGKKNIKAEVKAEM